LKFLEIFGKIQGRFGIFWKKQESGRKKQRFSEKWEDRRDEVFAGGENVT
jgi:hypothetical protein